MTDGRLFTLVRDRDRRLKGKKRARDSSARNFADFQGSTIDVGGPSLLSADYQHMSAEVLQIGQNKKSAQVTACLVGVKVYEVERVRFILDHAMQDSIDELEADRISLLEAFRRAQQSRKHRVEHRQASSIVDFVSALKHFGSFAIHKFFDDDGWMEYRNSTLLAFGVLLLDRGLISEDDLRSLETACNSVRPQWKVKIRAPHRK